MAILVQFIRDYARWIYGASALIALWYLRVVILARRDRRYATFALERESAINRTHQAGGVALSLAFAMGLAYFFGNVVWPQVATTVEIVTPTPAPLPPASPSPTQVSLPIPPIAVATSATSASTPTPRPSPTNLPTPSATPAPASQPPRCPDQHAIITAPGLNSEITSDVQIFGTAVHDRFQFYKLEWGNGAAPAVWSFFAEGKLPVYNGLLGTFAAGALPPGVYSVRLTVVDVTGNFPPPCQTTFTRR